MDSLKHMDPSSSEHPKLKQWVDQVLRIPFGKYHTLPLSLADPAEDIRSYLSSIQQNLHATVHGHDRAKQDILQLVSQWISNPSSIPSAIGIGGPPGTGKTTLVRHGIAKAMGRPFVQISLGEYDGSSFNGHSYTYEGAVCGKIVQALMQAQCMNPIIFFDELDKISESAHGQEV